MRPSSRSAVFARTLLATLAALLLAACQTGAPDLRQAGSAAVPTEIRKSPNDDRGYRYLELDNRLRVLLVSDPNTDKAAASLVVFRGSYHEPDAFPGLAHFLEHMLFIGTEKYPDVDAYQQFISQHGGSTNAYTAGDHVNYFFDIQPAYFEPAMDRFAQFFIAPRLDPAYVEREKNAVHSEYQMQIRNDGWRGNAVLATAISPAHPRARFNIGSLETLGDGVQDALRELFETQYSADQMALVALSSQSLDELEAWVRPMFGAIPDRDIGPAARTAPLFEPGQLPAVLSYQTIKDGDQVSYSFPVPALDPYYAQKPANYITNLLGHEGAGSLHQALVERGWIETLAAGTWNVDESTSLVNVDIELTALGRENIDGVTHLLFRYIDALATTPPEAWRYDEQAQVAELGFRFQEKSSATGFVYQVGPRLMRFPPEDVLIAPFLMTEFDRELIRSYLGYLTPDNLLMSVAGRNVETDRRERWFDVPYRLERRAAPRREVPDDGLALPARNPFLPGRLDLLADDPAGPAAAATRPGFALWLDRDTSFGTPRANLQLSLALEGGLATPRDRALAELWVALVDDALAPDIYPAYLAGLGYSLAADGRGFDLQINGYNDKQIELLGVVLERLRGLEIAPARFDVVRERLLREWQNYREERPFSQALGALNYLLLSDRWPPEALIDALADVTPADLARWRAARFDRFNVLGLYHGNVDAAAAGAVTEAVAAHLPLAAFPRPAPDVRTVSELARYPIDVAHEDAAIVLYVQDREASLAARAMSALTATILRQAYFTSLRTEQQLGYVVSLSNQTLRDRGGLAFIVQSPVASAAQLTDLTRTFLGEQADALAAMSADDFRRFQAGLLARLRERDRNLNDRTSRLWLDLDLDVTTFDTRERIAAEVEALDLAAVRAYLAQVREDFERRNLVIYAPGRFEAVPEAGPVISDVAAFKRGR
ncbi:MAG: insulinase family protein [Pseudomonadales bacterium]|nr:insulinase family protein [Pseudomonadales bacterium]